MFQKYSLTTFRGRCYQPCPSREWQSLLTESRSGFGVSVSLNGIACSLDVAAFVCLNGAASAGFEEFQFVRVRRGDAVKLPSGFENEFCKIVSSIAQRKLL